MKLRVLLALVVIAAVAGLWWIGREDSQPDRRREFVEAPDPVAGARDPVEPDSADPEPESEPDSTEGLPDDPVESGSCELLLKIVDAETNVPVRTEVVLWRLDAPANEHWTRGDQIQARKLAAHGIVRFGELPEGSYRAVCEGRRLAGEDSRALFVQGDLTEEAVAIHMPRKFRVYLKVFDLEGNPVMKGKIQRTGRSRMSTGRTPDWLRPRRMIRPGDGRFGRSGHGGGTTVVGRGGTASTATEKGFYLGEFGEDDYAWRKTYRVSVEVTGHATLRVRVKGDFEGETTYVGLVVPDEPIRERILLPDGTRADKSRAYLSVATTAIKDDGSDPMSRLLQQPVKVMARKKGYERLELEIPPGAPRETRYLVPAEPTGRQG